MAKLSDDFKREVKLAALRGVTQKKLAEAANVNVSWLSKALHEKAHIHLFDERIIKIGKLLAMSPSECFKETEEIYEYH